MYLFVLLEIVMWAISRDTWYLERNCWKIEHVNCDKSEQKGIEIFTSRRQCDTKSTAKPEGRYEHIQKERMCHPKNLVKWNKEEEICQDQVGSSCVTLPRGGHTLPSWGQVYVSKAMHHIFLFLNRVKLYSYYLLLLCSLVKPKMGQLLELPAGSLARGQFHAVTQFLNMFRQPNYQNGPLKSVPPPRAFGRPYTDVLGEMALWLGTWRVIPSGKDRLVKKKRKKKRKKNDRYLAGMWNILIYIFPVFPQ